MTTKGFYDPKCFVLADQFLIDHPSLRTKVNELASAIQDCIEDWLNSELAPHMHECQQCSKTWGPCDCDHPDRMDWCSANCRAAYDL